MMKDYTTNIIIGRPTAHRTHLITLPETLAVLGSEIDFQAPEIAS
jgi:hypothetical protein